MNATATRRPTLATGSDFAIRADHVEVAYQSNVVWHDATFDVGRGEFVAVIGPNGAGKTTLFRVLLGLLKSIDGRLEVFGESPRRGNPRIGYVPQRHTIDEDTHIAARILVQLGVTGNRWGPGVLSKVDREAVNDAIEAVGATELAGKRLGSLSGGELQRIFLAEALAGHPEMLLLDEPLSNLDMHRTRDLVEVVHDLVRTRGVTVLLVAHDINPLITCLNKVIYIANGRVATGRPDEVLTTESLTQLYGFPVEVLRDTRNNIVIVGGEDEHGEEGG